MIGLLIAWVMLVFWLVGTVWIVVTDRLFGGERWHLTTGWAFGFGILFAAALAAAIVLPWMLHREDRPERQGS
jgi:hypothetical protein